MKQQGLTGEELDQAIATFKQQKAAQETQKETDYQNLLQRNKDLEAQILNFNIDSKITSLAANEGISADKIPFLMKLVSRDNLADVDGLWGKDTTRRAQEVFGTALNGIVSNQSSAYKKDNPGLLASTFEWEKTPGKNGSSLIKAIQRKVGVNDDGMIGPKTIKAMQKWLGTIQDGKVSKPSQMVKAFQRWLNEQL